MTRRDQKVDCLTCPAADVPDLSETVLANATIPAPLPVSRH